jgi:signal transduction histidine kinase/CheY-like chemotaxis protein
VELFQLRYLPNIRYGTESYPEKIARRLRALNLAAWIGAAISTGLAVIQFLDPRPGIWKIAAVNAVSATVYAATPLLYRFGPHWAVTILFIAYAHFFVIAWLTGSGGGTAMFYLAFAGFAFLFFGAERILISVSLGVLALLLVLFLRVVVPLDTGLLSPADLFGFYLGAIVGSFTLLMASVFYVAREGARAEENLAREHEVSQEKTRQLEMANTYKSHFLASASHDLRQPLHALNLFVAQLQREADPAERSRLVGRIDAAVGSMNELFEALLDMTKLEAGILKINPIEFPIARSLEHIETTFADAARKKGLRLRVVASGAWVESDPVLLDRILLNLVSNAVHYTERGGVVVGCRRRGSELRIDVCDTGIGIPEDQRHNIFSEFYQLPGAAPDRQSGLGLGLAIVDRLSHLLGHAVELNSRPGRGSRFSVSLPLAPQPHDAAETAGRSLVIADPACGKRIIVIDDDPLVLDGMRGILQSWGCQVQTASSGAAALTSLKQDSEPPDLIISDSRLAGGMTGIEAIQSLREAVGAPVPAFVITGDTAPERLREASAGGFPLLHKPVSPMALRTTVNRLLNAHDARVSGG